AGGSHHESRRRLERGNQPASGHFPLPTSAGRLADRMGEGAAIWVGVRAGLALTSDAPAHGAQAVRSPEAPATAAEYHASSRAAASLCRLGEELCEGTIFR